MNYEQKYKEALERARKLYKDAITLQLEQDIKDYEQIFPELKESEDERIKESLMQYIWNIYHREYCPPTPSIETCDKWIDWIEKQGVKKKEWSEEDERNLNGIIDEIQANKSNAPSYDIKTYDRFLNWLKSLKDRVRGKEG